MLAQVEIRTAMDTFHFLETERHFEFDIGSSICIVGQFFVIVVAIFFVTQSHRLMPFQTGSLPLLEPFHLFARTNEELHFHLFELAHTENELTGNDLVTESLTDLGDTERYFHAAGLLYVQEVDENTLCRFRAQIYFHGTIGSRSHLRREHQVKLADIGPVAGSGDRADDFAIQDQLAQVFEIRIVHVFRVAFVDLVPLSLVFKHTSVRRTELSFVKSFAELLCSLGHFLIHLLLYLCQVIFDQNIGTISFLGIFVIDQGIIEGIDMAGCFPDSRMHKDSRVDTDYIFVQQRHTVPPVFLYVIFQFYAILSVIVHCT